MTTKTDQYPMRAVPGFYSSTEGIQLAYQTSADASDEDLQFYQQLGVEWAMVNINDNEQHSLEFYKQLVKRFGSYGIKIYRITNLSVHNVPEITLNLPGAEVQPIDQSRFSLLNGNLVLFLLFVVAAWTTIAFGEEMFYRAFLINRVIQLGEGVAQFHPANEAFKAFNSGWVTGFLFCQR